MTFGRELLEIAQSHDMNNETHHGKLPPPSMHNHGDSKRHNTISWCSNNHSFHVKQGSRSDMVNNKGDNTNTRGEDEYLEID